jgi:DNA-directed RNA polymerase subunit RPC12/RpoP
LAQAVKYNCTHCKHEIVAWDEGDPYFLDRKGAKVYAYHPNPDRDRCIGVDSPHLCLDCGSQFRVDSRAPIDACMNCGSKNIANIYVLENRRCPACRKGTFVRDPKYVLIS